MTVTSGSYPSSPCLFLLPAVCIITFKTKFAAILYSSAEPCNELSSKGKWLDLKGLWVGLATDNLCKTPCKWIFYSSPIWLPLNDAMWHWAWKPRLTSGWALHCTLYCAWKNFEYTSILLSPCWSLNFLWCHWQKKESRNKWFLISVLQNPTGRSPAWAIFEAIRPHFLSLIW